MNRGALTINFLSVGAACLFSIFSCCAQSLTWQEARSNALSLALSQGKLVLLLAGRHTCGNCNFMQNTVCETTSPAIRQLIQDRFVPWFCVVDTSTEWYPYATGLGSFTLPLICCIDPNNPDAYLDRTTGIQDTQAFYNRLLAQAGGSTTRVVIKQCWASSGRISLSLTNLVSGKINTIERSPDLRTWTPVAVVASAAGGTNWSEPLNGGWTKAFYRVSVMEE